MVGIKRDIKEEKLHVHAGTSIQDKTKALLKEIKENDLEELKELYKYDLELFAYDANIYF